MRSPTCFVILIERNLWRPLVALLALLLALCAWPTAARAQDGSQRKLAPDLQQALLAGASPRSWLGS